MRSGEEPGKQKTRSGAAAELTRSSAQWRGQKMETGTKNRKWAFGKEPKQNSQGDAKFSRRMVTDAFAADDLRHCIVPWASLWPTRTGDLGVHAEAETKVGEGEEQGAEPGRRIGLRKAAARYDGLRRADAVPF
jgi:hypothetical protein